MLPWLNKQHFCHSTVWWSQTYVPLSWLVLLFTLLSDIAMLVAKHINSCDKLVWLREQTHLPLVTTLFISNNEWVHFIWQPHLFWRQMHSPAATGTFISRNTFQTFCRWPVLHIFTTATYFGSQVTNDIHYPLLYIMVLEYVLHSIWKKHNAINNEFEFSHSSAYLKHETLSFMFSIIMML